MSLKIGRTLFVPINLDNSNFSGSFCLLFTPETKICDLFLSTQVLIQLIPNMLHCAFCQVYASWKEWQTIFKFVSLPHDAFGHFLWFQIWNLNLRLLYKSHRGRLRKHVSRLQRSTAIFSFENVTNRTDFWVATSSLPQIQHVVGYHRYWQLAQGLSNCVTVYVAMYLMRIVTCVNHYFDIHACHTLNAQCIRRSCGWSTRPGFSFQCQWLTRKLNAKLKE